MECQKVLTMNCNNKMYDMICENKLSLNIEKKKYMLLDMKVQCIEIQRVSDFWFCGLTINESVTRKRHS